VRAGWANWYVPRANAALLPDENRFKGLNGLLTLIQSGDRVHIEIDAESVAELIGDELGIDAGLTAETGMRASHDLERGPVELDRLQPRCNEPSQVLSRPSGVVTFVEGKTQASGSEQPLCCRHAAMRFRVVNDKATVRFERSLLGRSSFPR